MDVSTMTTFGEEKAREVAALVEKIKEHIQFLDEHSFTRTDAIGTFAAAARAGVNNIVGVYEELVALNESWTRKTSQLTEMEEACKQKGIELEAAYQQKERELEAAYQQKDMELEATYQQKQEELRLKTAKAERQFPVLETATVEQEKSKVERESGKAELEQQLLERNCKIQDLELYAKEREEAVQSQISNLEAAKTDLTMRKEELEKQLAEKGKGFEDLKRKAEDGAESLSKQLSILENVSEELKKTKADTEDKFVEMEKKCAEAVAAVQELERKLKSKEDVEKQLADKDLIISGLEEACRVQQDKEEAAVAASVAAHRLEMEKRLRAEFEAEKGQWLREREAHLRSAESLHDAEADARSKAQAAEAERNSLEAEKLSYIDAAAALRGAALLLNSAGEEKHAAVYATLQSQFEEAQQGRLAGSEELDEKRKQINQLQKQIEDMRVQHQLDLVRAKGEFETTQVQTQVQVLSDVVAANGEQLSKELKTLEDARVLMARVTQSAFLAADNAFDHMQVSSRLRSRVHNWHRDLERRGAQLDLQEEALRTEAGTGDIFLQILGAHVDQLGGRIDQALDHLGGRVDQALEQADDDRQNVMRAGKVVIDFAAQEKKEVEGFSELARQFVEWQKENPGFLNTVQELSEKINSLSEVMKMPGAKRDREESPDVGPLRKKVRTDSGGAYGLEVGESSTSQQAAMPQEEARKGKEVERRSPVARQVSDSPPTVPQMDDGRRSPSPVSSGSPRVGEADEHVGEDTLEIGEDTEVIRLRSRIDSSFAEICGSVRLPQGWDMNRQVAFFAALFDKEQRAYTKAAESKLKKKRPSGPFRPTTEEWVTLFDKGVIGTPQTHGGGSRICFMALHGRMKVTFPVEKAQDGSETVQNRTALCATHKDTTRGNGQECVFVRWAPDMDAESDWRGAVKWVVEQHPA